MSVLQKLFNFVHSSPRATHFKVRDLNVYFKESINPTYKLINLDNVETLELQVEIEENEDKEYTLVAYIKREGKESDVILGSFETRREADYALHKVKNRLFGNGKTLLSIANGFVLIVVYTVFTVGFLNSFRTDTGMPSLTSNSLPNMSLNATNTGNNSNINMADMSKLQKQLLQQALQQANQQGLGIGTGSVPTGMPNGGALMNNIVSGAIQQAQSQSPVPGMPVPQAPQNSNVQAVEKSTVGDDILKQIK